MADLSNLGSAFLFQLYEKIYSNFLKTKGVSTDSREDLDGKMFFALKGPNFDGNQFALKSLEKGAMFAITDDPELEGKARGIIAVKNSLKCLQKLAAFHRNKIKHTVLGLTGSNGKTTTKELIAAVLSKKFNLHATKGNFNNHIGLPLTLLNMPQDSNFLVLEMGANARGEIAALCEIGRPDCGLITNIGKAHIEGFGGIEGIKIAKGELYEFLRGTNGTAFVNESQEFLKDMSAGIKNIVWYTSDFDHARIGETCLIELKKVHPSIEFEVNDEVSGRFHVKSNITGSYNFHNIITALAVGHHFKVPIELMGEAIAEFVPRGNRSQVIELNGNTLFMDAYNANPSSMKVSVTDFLKNYSRPSLLILGDMLELGDESIEEHRALVENLIAQKHLYDELWLVGSEFGKLSYRDKKIKYFTSSAEARKYFQEGHIKAYNIFLKGSRGIKLESIFDNLPV